MSIDYGKLKYTTNRILKHKNGKFPGQIKMYSFDEKEFTFTIVCPVCGKKSDGKVQLLKRPYFVPCVNCDTKHVISRLR